MAGKKSGLPEELREYLDAGKKMVHNAGDFASALVEQENAAENKVTRTRKKTGTSQCTGNPLDRPSPKARMIMNIKRLGFLFIAIAVLSSLLIPNPAEARRHFRRHHPVAAVKRAVHHVTHHLGHIFHPHRNQS